MLRGARHASCGDRCRQCGQGPWRGTLRRKEHDVIYGVRDVKRSDANPAETVEKAIAETDAIILATPYDATGPLLRKHGAALAGKVVIDATNLAERWTEL